MNRPATAAAPQIVSVIRAMMVIYSNTFFEQLAEGSLRSARIVLKELLDGIGPIHSVADIGCGVATWCKAAVELGSSRVMGIDGDYVDRSRLMIDPTLFRACDLSEIDGIAKVASGARFDLVISVEVAEHLPASCAGNFIRGLCELGDLVLFSAAIPGQGGRNHINEQWPDYWAALFAENQFVCFDVIRQRVWDRQQCEFWYAQNCLLFARDGSAAFVAASKISPTLGSKPLRLVHPRLIVHPGWQPPPQRA